MHFLQLIQKKQSVSVFAAILLGLLGGYLNWECLNLASDFIALVFVNLLKMLSLPLVFLTIVSTLTGMESYQHMRLVGGQILKYTTLTTLIAAAVALVIYLLVDPLSHQTLDTQFVESAKKAMGGMPVAQQQHGYGKYLLDSIPSNFIEPFISGNVIGILLLALLLSFAVMGLETKEKETCHQIFKSFAAAFLKLAEILMLFIPVAVFAFGVKIWQDLRSDLALQSLGLYAFCIVSANLVQALVVLPALVKLKGGRPFYMLKTMHQVLLTAFFSKSSAATLPLTIKESTKKLKISPQIANISLPICTTMNMNACAGFILITYLFVSSYHGYDFSMTEMIAWIFIASLAAAGNAAVPMGCFFLASAFLSASQVPLNLLGIILPLYAIIDMLETAINVWSDICVTQMVEMQMQKQKEL